MLKEKREIRETSLIRMAGQSHPDGESARAALIRLRAIRSQGGCPRVWYSKPAGFWVEDEFGQAAG